MPVNRTGGKIVFICTAKGLTREKRLFAKRESELRNENLEDAELDTFGVLLAHEEQFSDGTVSIAFLVIAPYNIACDSSWNNVYEVFGAARHCETGEPMVAYRALYSEGGLWVRPAEMWNETAERNGRTMKRMNRASCRLT